MGFDMSRLENYISGNGGISVGTLTDAYHGADVPPDGYIKVPTDGSSAELEVSNYSVLSSNTVHLPKRFTLVQYMPPLPVNGSWATTYYYRGSAVAYSKDGLRMAISNPTENAATYPDVALIIYLKVGGVWTLEQEIPGIRSPVNCIAFTDNGDRIAFGMPDSNLTSQLGGAVHIYARTGTTWSLEKNLISKHANRDDKWGGALAFSGDGTWLIVGEWSYQTASEINAGDAGQGAVYFFQRSGSNYTRRVLLDHDVSTSYRNAFFGEYVDIDKAGDWVVVGQPAMGRLYILSRDGTAWNIVQTFTVPPEKEGLQSFGEDPRISSDGTTIICGTTSLFVYRRTGTRWALDAIIDVPESHVDQVSIGFTNAISDDNSRIFTGAGNTSVVFDNINGTWTMVAELRSHGRALDISPDGTRLLNLYEEFQLEDVPVMLVEGGGKFDTLRIS